MTIDLNQPENCLGATVSQMWVNTGLNPSEFSNPVLILLFLRYAERTFHKAEATRLNKGLVATEIDRFAYQVEGPSSLSEKVGFSSLLNLAAMHEVCRLKTKSCRPCCRTPMGSRRQ